MAQPTPRQLDEDAALDLGRQLCELSAHIQAAQAEFTLGLAAFDDDAGWGGAGIRSCAHWLSIQVGLDLHTSADLLRVGRSAPARPGAGTQVTCGDGTTALSPQPAVSKHPINHAATVIDFNVPRPLPR